MLVCFVYRWTVYKLNSFISSVNLYFVLFLNRPSSSSLCLVLVVHICPLLLLIIPPITPYYLVIFLIWHSYVRLPDISHDLLFCIFYVCNNTLLFLLYFSGPVEMQSTDVRDLRDKISNRQSQFPVSFRKVYLSQRRVMKQKKKQLKERQKIKIKE